MARPIVILGGCFCCGGTGTGTETPPGCPYSGCLLLTITDSGSLGWDGSYVMIPYVDDVHPSPCWTVSLPNGLLVQGCCNSGEYMFFITCLGGQNSGNECAQFGFDNSVSPDGSGSSSNAPSAGGACLACDVPEAVSTFNWTVTGTPCPEFHSRRKQQPAGRGLGTLLEKAIVMVAQLIPSERIRAWLGSCPTCKERRDRLNAFTWWAAGYIVGRRTAEQLEQLMRDDNK